MGMILLSLALAAEPPAAFRDIPIVPRRASATLEGGDPTTPPAEGTPTNGGVPPVAAEGTAPAEGAPPAAPVENAPPAAPVEGAPPAAPVEGAQAAPLDDPDEVRELTLEERRSEAAGIYMTALTAWRDGRWKRAWHLATEALTLDPDLTPARLLAGYALLKLRRTEEAQVTLGGLALEPGPSPIDAARRREAARVVRRHVVPYRRDQWSLTAGSITFVERTGDYFVPLGGYVFSARAPILERISVRVDAANPWGGTAEDLDVRGPRFGLYAVTSQPLGQGRWHLDLAAGPAFWIAEGRYWQDGWEPYIGARGSVGLDVRLGSVLGLRYEMGASAYPWATDELAFYAEPFDFRLSLETWFGK